MKKLFLSIIFAILLVNIIIVPNSALADGCIFVPRPDGGWGYGDETDQKAFINYEDGSQKMILSIGIEQKGNKNAVWIFPVPAEAEKVDLDVISQLPRLFGTNLVKDAKENLDAIHVGLLFTQAPLVVPAVVPAVMLFKRALINQFMGHTAGLDDDAERGVDEIKIHKHIEKKGITSEIITAKNASSIYHYLRSKDLDVKEGDISVLDYYIGKEFSFIVSWISGNITGATKRGVYVTFPTKDIFYPLVPTSVYGDNIIPAHIYMIGFVKPKIFKDISEFVQVSYFSEFKSRWVDDEGYNSYYEPKDFFGKAPIGDLKYTKITIDAPSKKLTKDLWIKRTPPAKIILAWCILSHPWPIGFIMLALSSMFTGFLSGPIIFKEARNKKGLVKFALIGLSNCLSVLGLIIVMIVTQIRNIPQEDKNVKKQHREKDSKLKTARKDYRKLGFVVTFSVFFLVISSLMVLMIEKLLELHSF